MPTPYLSIIVTARNDNHGGSFLERMQIFCDAMLAQMQRHKIESELIIVEWNPPTERLPLKEALKIDASNKNCKVKIITVPHQVHSRYRYADKLFLYQMIAKNVGIQRAAGEYLLATNVDVIFSDELCEFLAKRELEPNKIYRTDRYDISNKIQPGCSINQLLEYCTQNIIRINTYFGTTLLKTGQHVPDQFDIEVLSQEEKELVITHLNDEKGLIKLPYLHTIACGDFQLMHKKHWQELRGYPEYDCYSLHIDSIFEFMCYKHTLQEIYLTEPLRLYHIDHDDGFLNESPEKIEENLKFKQVPKLDGEQFYEIVSTLLKSDHTPYLNSENWGLNDFALREETLY